MCAASGGGEAVRAGPPPAQTQVPNAEYPPAFLEAVKAAVAKGVQALRDAQQMDGSWGPLLYRDHYPGGQTALALTTLLKCGVPPRDRGITKGFSYLKSAHACQRTYEVGLVLMALGAKYEAPEGPEAPPEVASAGEPPESPKDSMPKEDREWIKKEVAFLREAQQADGLWGYPAEPPGLADRNYASPTWTDLSNTQYAIFGLRAAKRCGIEVEPGLWARALTQLLKWQAQKGPATTLKGNTVRGPTRTEWTEPAKARGFGYADSIKNAEATGSMTAAGTAALMICAEAMGDDFTPAQRTTVREGVRDGLAWIQDRFSVQKNVGRDAAAEYYLYYMYGLERVGDLSYMRFFGTQDWYQLGGQRLMEKQKKSGGWDIGFSLNSLIKSKGESDIAQDVTDTCFALLFLCRGTPRLARPIVTPDPVPTPPGK